MTTVLHRLIYLSRQVLDPDDADLQVSDIIRASIRNNREVAITGLLLVHDGWFMQALEGPEAAVDATYRRIVADPRHDAARLLGSGPAPRREFAGWNMCARRIGEADAAILERLDTHPGLALDRLDGRAALRLLKAVRQIQSATERDALT